MGFKQINTYQITCDEIEESCSSRFVVAVETKAEAEAIAATDYGWYTTSSIGKYYCHEHAVARELLT